MRVRKDVSWVIDLFPNREIKPALCQEARQHFAYNQKQKYSLFVFCIKERKRLTSLKKNQCKKKRVDEIGAY